MASQGRDRCIISSIWDPHLFKVMSNCLRQYLLGAWVLPIHSRELGFGHSTDLVHGCKFKGMFLNIGVGYLLI